MLGIIGLESSILCGVRILSIRRAESKATEHDPQIPGFYNSTEKLNLERQRHLRRRRIRVRGTISGCVEKGRQKIG